MEIPLIGRLRRRASKDLPVDSPPAELGQEQAALDAYASGGPMPAPEELASAMPVPASETPPVVKLRYQFPGPMRVGHTSKLPSGRVYKLYAFGTREFYANAEDVDALLGYKGECCNSHKKRPLFERA